MIHTTFSTARWVVGEERVTTTYEVILLDEGDDM
jgi:hypothetical protein